MLIGYEIRGDNRNTTAERKESGVNPAITGCGIYICFESLFVLKFWFLITYPASCCAVFPAFPKQLENPIEINGVLHLGMCCVPAGIKSPEAVTEDFL